ncbi:hypothetical protein DEO72_LG6g573 [Vigna unguiculata]|uniref:Uncharacterized protein n=1 Tax=Vigna unguiculata TaxID=3917 RepID=A0A4D6M6T2_VIGUN|nr:hypothetical protein DEO72_LG6g573 [Vigna unguiculata]
MSSKQQKKMMNDNCWWWGAYFLCVRSAIVDENNSGLVLSLVSHLVALIALVSLPLDLCLLALYVKETTFVMRAE